MKKYIKYILILVVMVSFFSLKNISNADTDPLGNCTVSGKPTMSNYTEKACNAQKGAWSAADTPKGTCVVKNVTQNGQWTAAACAQSGGKFIADYQYLAPLPDPNNNGNPLTTFNPADTTAFSNYLNLIIKTIIGLAAIMAVVMITIGGVEYMTSELISSKESGKDKITGAVFGLVLALGAYALLNTINPDLLKDNVDISNIDVQITLSLQNENIAQQDVNGKYTRGNLTYTKGEDWATRAGPEADLRYSGATVYNKLCATVGETSCTSTRGLDPTTLNAIHDKCPSCKLSIQGGTEFWAHNASTNHDINHSNVDLGINQNLNQYISDGKPLVASTWYQKDGLWYFYEVNHWHASGATKN